MGKTIVEKILGAHAGRSVAPGDIVDVQIDARVARDFGGANVVKNLEAAGLAVDDPARTFFTFDCNPGGSDQKYARNQQLCREFARKHGITVHDIDQGIGTHLALDGGLVGPGSTFISTDSHANIMGAVGAFGQGMGDVDIAHAFAWGKVWFQVPATLKVVLTGFPALHSSAKDLTLAVLRRIGAAGFLGMAAEFYGPAVDRLDLAGRITLASMATEMGGITSLIPPSEAVLAHCAGAMGREMDPVLADPDAEYVGEIEIDVEGLSYLLSRPGRPDDVVEASEVVGTKIGSAFIGSCTNGRFEDLQAAAEVLRGRRVAPGVVLKVVPSTDRIWKQCLDQGILAIFKEAGVLVGNAGCAGCAAGQIGQNGPGEVTVSTGNRNFPGKQGQGEVYLASPAVAAASAVAGAIALPEEIPQEPHLFSIGAGLTREGEAPATTDDPEKKRPTVIEGRVWSLDLDHVDTDMIYHNRHLAVTDPAEMGQHTFGNLDGYEDFPTRVQPGDIVVIGSNFGCGSSRQQAVDCFGSLGISLLVARSFGAIYERNAINSGFPILVANLTDVVQDGDVIGVDLATGTIRLPDGREVAGRPFSSVQMEIYQRGGLLR